MMKKLWCAIKADCKTENSDFKFIFFKCIIIGLLIFISLWVHFFTWLALAAIILFSLTQWNGRAVYYAIFSFCFMDIFKVPNRGVMLYIIVLAFIVMLLGVKFFIEVMNKTKSINWSLTIVCVLTIIMFFAPFGFKRLDMVLALVGGLGFVYVWYVFRKDISLKEVAFIFLLGMLFSFQFGLFHGVSTYLQDSIPLLWGNRYSGAFWNPNQLAIYSVFGISLYYFLFLNRNIKPVFYPAFAFFALCALLSLSKAGLIMNVLLFIMFTAMLLVTLKKKSLVPLGKCAVIIIVIILCCFPQSKLLFDRIISPFQTNDNSGIVNNNSNNESHNDGWIADLTTDRDIIWESYGSAIFSSIKTIIFGHGADAPCPNGGTGAHNWYLQFWFHYGLVGFCMLGAIVFCIIGRNGFKKLNWHALLCVVALFGYMFAESIFKTFLGFAAVLLLPALFYKNTEFVEKIDIYSANAKNQIPKIIHYIWLGGNPLPKVVEKCIKSWQEVLPNYEIKRWDESNVNIESSSQYLKEAYASRKYAFAADALRFEILYKEGGVYLDTDVLVIKSLDKFLHHKIFMGFETKTGVNPGLIMGAEKNSPLMKEMFEQYKTKKFKKEDGSLDLTTIVRITTDELIKKGLKLNNEFQVVDDSAIYPTEYFSPLNLITSRTETTANTHTVHLCAATWYGKKKKAIRLIKNTANFFTNGWFGVVAYKLRDRKIRKAQ